ncbi:hypothetical protein HO173_000211 [Letharia columbiana]|uniref:Tim10-like domain-containing protein n=1 Tax=Letharia columbiana TaxID=112416 RepID=A0A8H6G6L2_9LECA|nr:uncharacterized protein HO173_000211 [Letharia columbiana]KAF6241501.1 hypothetical protein HO173_000211 [Letharia columbiana]
MDQRQAQVDIDRLSDRDKRDLQQSINNEMQKAKIQESVHELTDICWTKCVTGAISSSGLDRKEEPCVRNCVERFLDANEAVLKHLSVMRGQGGCEEGCWGGNGGGGGGVDGGQLVGPLWISTSWGSVIGAGLYGRMSGDSGGMDGFFVRWALQYSICTGRWGA